MTDLSKTNGNVSKAVFWDMNNRYNNYNKTNTNKAKIVFLKADHKDWVTSECFEDMQNRFNNYRINNNGKEPAIIYFQAPEPTPIPSNNNLYRTIRYRQFQDQQTGYWCGPFMVSQILYELFGVEVAQSWLAEIAYTSSAGTDHNGVIRDITTWAAQNGHVVKAWFQNFSEMGDSIDARFRALGGAIASPYLGIGIHGFYKDHWGHYMYPVEVNMDNRTITIIDSLNEEDLMIVSFEDMARWIRETPGNQSSILVVQK